MPNKIEHITEGSIFVDEMLGFPPEHRIKAELVDEIAQRMATDQLTQAAAVKRIGIGQPALSNILRGRFRGYSINSLTAMLDRLG